jgi:hypothetical protein
MHHPYTILCGLLNLAQALQPRSPAEPTISSQHVALGWSPRTTAVAVPAAVFELRRRQQIDVNDQTCAYLTDGLVTCASDAQCAYDQALSAFGCCPSTSSFACAIGTSCVDYADVTNVCSVNGTSTSCGPNTGYW